MLHPSKGSSIPVPSFENDSSLNAWNAVFMFYTELIQGLFHFPKWYSAILKKLSNNNTLELLIIFNFYLDLQEKKHGWWMFRAWMVQGERNLTLNWFIDFYRFFDWTQDPHLPVKLPISNVLSLMLTTARNSEGNDLRVATTTVQRAPSLECWYYLCDFDASLRNLAFSNAS